MALPWYAMRRRAEKYHAEQAQLRRQQREYGCTYCGKPVPDSIEPAMFRCCGEVGHTVDITEE